MKITNLFKCFMVAFAFVAFGCSSSDEPNDDGGGGGGQSQVTSIVLSASTTNMVVGENVTFTVMTNPGENVSSSATIEVNNAAITGNAYSPGASGNLSVTATYQSLTSNTVNVTVDIDAIKFKRNVLIEDYTGTWCGWCPRVSHAIELVRAETDQAIIIANHQGDEFSTAVGNSLDNSFGVTGYPTAKLNRTTDWNFPEPNNVNQVLNMTGNNADAGLALKPVLNGGTMSVDVSVKFGEDFVGSNAKIAVYLIEDGIAADQQNYTSYYGGGSVLTGFVHNDILRAAFTAALGEDVPSDQIVGANVYTTNFSISVPGNVVNTANTRVVAVLTTGSNAGLNSREAHFGDDQSFEEIE